MLCFKYKNYVSKITQKEIYTTEKYLYAKSLRSVALTISCHGINKNARKAINGAFRENGKLILDLTNEDLVEMLKDKREGIPSSSYLLKN